MLLKAKTDGRKILLNFQLLALSIPHDVVGDFGAKCMRPSIEGSGVIRVAVRLF
jgi:ribosomal protein S5